MEPQSSKSAYLDFLRGASAMAVVVGHFRHLLFAKQGGIAASILLLATGLAHQAVVVFFVLSGYLIGGKLLERRAQEVDPVMLGRQYLINRTARIYPALLGALLLTVAADRVTRIFWKGAGTLPEEFGIVHLSVQALPSAGDLLSGLFLGQVFTKLGFGSNQPLWSLSFEWWIYFLFPLLLARRTRWLGVVLLAALAGAGRLEFAVLFTIWVIGAIARRAESTLSRGGRVAAYASGIAALGFAVLSKYAEIRTSPLGRYGADLALAVSTASSIPLVGPRFWAKGTHLWKWLASLSYSLYLTHFPLMFTIMAFTASRLRGNVFAQYALADPGGWVVFLLGLSLMVLVALGMSMVLERPLHRYKAALEWAVRQLPTRKARVASPEI